MHTTPLSSVSPEDTPRVAHFYIQDIPLDQWCIVTAESLPCGLKHALGKFIEYMQRATGVVLPAGCATTPPTPHCILIGETSLDTPLVCKTRAELAPEGYLLCVQQTEPATGGRLYITGATERGTIYGLYAFLETLVGWRFLSADSQVVHPADEIRIPGDLFVTDQPYFEYRGLLWEDCLSSPDQTNALRLNSTFSCDLKQHGGGVVYGGGFVHTLNTLAEMSDHQPGAQPCLTDEKVYQTVLKNVRAILAADPSVNIISVSQNDSYAEQLGCQCEKCRAIDQREGTPMGSLLTFVNRIANEIKDEYPHVSIDTLAYRYTRKAPKTIKPADNVIIRLCSIECCFSHPIEDATCPDNIAFCQDIQEWAAICNRMYIWDYTTDFLFYLAPFPNFGVLRENVRFFKEHHVAGLFEQGNYQSVSGEFAELRSYLLAHLLWNPDMTQQAYEDMINDFLACYYGPGWKHIRQYIDWSVTNAAHRHLHIYDHPQDIIPPYAQDGTPATADAVLGGMVALWDNALREAVTPEQRQHVEKSRLAAEFALLSTCPDSRTDKRQEALLSSIRAHRITYLHEGALLSDHVDAHADPKSW